MPRRQTPAAADPNALTAADLPDSPAPAEPPNQSRVKRKRGPRPKPGRHPGLNPSGRWEQPPPADEQAATLADLAATRANLATYDPVVWMPSICREIARGATVSRLARREGWPDSWTVRHWLRKDEAYAQMMREAEALRVDHVAEELLDIADDATDDYVTVAGKDGSERTRVNNEAVQRSRLRADVRMRLLATWAPKVWSPKADITLNGTLAVETMPDSVLNDRLAQLAGRLGIELGREVMARIGHATTNALPSAATAGVGADVADAIVVEGGDLGGGDGTPIPAAEDPLSPHPVGRGARRVGV